MGLNFWDPSEGEQGMFDVWSFKGIGAIVSSGLGGGSLIYANVMLRKDRSWFSQPDPYHHGQVERWCFGRDDLDPHYKAVETFLGVQTLPRALEVPKTKAFLEAARGLAGPGTVDYAPLAVRFRDGLNRPAVGAVLPEEAYPNIFGLPRRTCRMTGECDIGCNEGAKSSLDHTYLSAASHHGASIHLRTEVRTITRIADGTFDVGFVEHRPGDDVGKKTDTAGLAVRHIHARRVVLSAGTLGSTYLMLANQERLKLDNPALGTRFCGNGDLLGFILRSKEVLEGTNGPVITSYLRYPDRVDTGNDDDFGMYIEDAGYPLFLTWLLQAPGQLARFPWVFGRRALPHRHRDTSLSDDISDVLGTGALTAHALPLLGMGRDVPDGSLYLSGTKNGRPILDSTWTTRTSLKYFETMKSRMRSLADALSAEYVVNPTYLLRRVITVHPLGGCPADTSRTPGVVDTYGRVRGVPGLRICDGSVFPGPVGANPSLTIAAFAHRAATDLCAEDIDAPAPDALAFVNES
jgi:cholesterol oxidase